MPKQKTAKSKQVITEQNNSTEKTNQSSTDDQSKTFTEDKLKQIFSGDIETFTEDRMKHMFLGDIERILKDLDPKSDSRLGTYLNAILVVANESQISPLEMALIGQHLIRMSHLQVVKSAMIPKEALISCINGLHSVILKIIEESKNMIVEEIQQTYSENPINPLLQFLQNIQQMANKSNMDMKVIAADTPEEAIEALANMLVNSLEEKEKPLSSFEKEDNETIH